MDDDDDEDKQEEEEEAAIEQGKVDQTNVLSSYARWCEHLQWQ